MNEITQYKRNILKTWRQVSHEDIKAGTEWYPTAYTLASEIGKGDVKEGRGDYRRVLANVTLGYERGDGQECHR
jgi:hypothetical protein